MTERKIFVRNRHAVVSVGGRLRGDGRPTHGVAREGENIRPVTWVTIEEICSLEWSIGGPARTTGAVPAFAAGKK